MREFEKDSKINFVDENDVLVGFSNKHSCCERFGWFYSKSAPRHFDDRGQTITDPSLESYAFDRDYFREVAKSDESDCGGMVVFRLRDSCGSRSIYLCLYNSHNGYYSHGFTQEVGGVKIREGSL